MLVSIKRQRSGGEAKQEAGPVKNLSWSELRAAAKKQGVNVFGKSREAIEHEIQSKKA